MTEWRGRGGDGGDIWFFFLFVFFFFKNNFLVVPSFAKLSQGVSELFCGHNLQTIFYKRVSFR